MERREHARTRVWFPVQLDRSSGESVVCVCYDVSKTGIMVSSTSLIEAGVDVKVTLRIPPENPLERAAPAHVVRSGLNEDDPDGLWGYRIALEFEEPIPELDGLLEEVAASKR